MLSEAKITILSENRVINPRLMAEQGLCIFVETPHGNLLFDTGQTEAFLRNARELKIDLQTVQKIVLSHGHYDHTGGLPLFLQEYGLTEIICHPAIFNKKYRVYPAGRVDIGVQWERSDLKAMGAKFVLKTHAVQILPDVWISGEIPRHSDYEHIDESYQQRPMVSYIHDEIHDDMCLILNTVKGLFILLGCGHAGPVNSIKQSIRITGNKKIYAVIGGMHLQHSHEGKINQIVKNIRKLDPEYILPLHCTGFPAISRMMQIFKDRVNLLNVGDSFSCCEND
jgi:7,8-dihydropterin-6-yl-methyl-4-(beta-D-ribofuranosyl)aminobenzene 5'-phosphate synthase